MRRKSDSTREIEFWEHALPVRRLPVCKTSGAGFVAWTNRRVSEILSVLTPQPQGNLSLPASPTHRPLV